MNETTVISLNLPGMRKPMPEERRTPAPRPELEVEIDLTLAAELEAELEAEFAAELEAELGLEPVTGVQLDLATWQDRALCSQTDPEAFFPEKGGSTREAKKVCQGCDVRVECLEYALANDERFGIWGGLSERERRRVKREAI